MQLPAQDKTRSGADSTDALTLQRLEPMDGSGTVAALRGIRRVEKLIETFITMLEEKPFDGFLHGNFNQCGTVTGPAVEPVIPTSRTSRPVVTSARRCALSSMRPMGMDMVVIDYARSRCA